jgi:type IV secretion system protein VirB5
MNVNDVRPTLRLLRAGRVAAATLALCAAGAGHAQGVPTISPPTRTISR